MNKPKIVKDWLRSMETIESMCPKCCHTCCNMNGIACTKYGAIPKDFMDKIGECGEWNREPF